MSAQTDLLESRAFMAFRLTPREKTFDKHIMSVPTHQLRRTLDAVEASQRRHHASRGDQPARERMIGP
jgi:hypothetical protein